MKESELEGAQDFVDGHKGHSEEPDLNSVISELNLLKSMVTNSRNQIILIKDDIQNQIHQLCAKVVALERKTQYAVEMGQENVSKKRV